MNFFSALLYYLVVLPISWLPLAITYRLADFLYLIFFYLTGYRKKVVRENMRRSFPDKSETEIRRLMKLFYHHFTDLFVESLRIFSMTEREAMRRMKYINPEIFNRHFEEGRNIIIAGGHYNNWELFAVTVARAMKHRAVGLYKPLSNAFFDKKMQETRSRYGLCLASIKKVRQEFADPSGRPSAIIFAIDQSPHGSSKAHWVKFLQQDTAVLFGTEKYAREFNCPVYYGVIRKIKRGHYELSFILITENPNAHPLGWITEEHTRLLEDDILRAPQYWLWTHRRWKLRSPSGRS